jgi:hypothetical protein
VKDSHWEPDGVTLQVRFCEGGATYRIIGDSRRYSPNATFRRIRFSLPGIHRLRIQRGNNRSACFPAEEDYRRYLNHLPELSAHFDCTVHVCVLMPNDVRLLPSPEKTDDPTSPLKHLRQRCYLTRLLLG